MVHDKNGQELREGDLVIVPCRVTRLGVYLDLLTVDFAPGFNPSVLHLHPLQVTKGMQIPGRPFGPPDMADKLAKFREETISVTPAKLTSNFYNQKIIVPATTSADDANRLYGERYGTDWEYEVQPKLCQARVNPADPAGSVILMAEESAPAEGVGTPERASGV